MPGSEVICCPHRPSERPQCRANTGRDAVLFGGSQYGLCLYRCADQSEECEQNPGNPQNGGQESDTLDTDDSEEHDSDYTEASKSRHDLDHLGTLSWERVRRRRFVASAPVVGGGGRSSGVCENYVYSWGGGGASAPFGSGSLGDLGRVGAVPEPINAASLLRGMRLT